MKDRDEKLVIGALLHDIGKVVYRQGQYSGTHSESGYEYLKTKFTDDLQIDASILECVRYHHADALKNADIAADAQAYIVYIADNIASALDRRKKEDGKNGFERHTTLQPVFNILNGNCGDMYYKASVLNPDKDINYPQNMKEEFDAAQYNSILQNITDNIRGLSFNSEYINSLLEVLEGNLSFVPSSTASDEIADISLYDHLKITAAVASCIGVYLEDKGITDYREHLFVHAKDFYSEKAFMLASLDVSGIQKFIYTITTKNALKMLRSRSFYLEIMMEHIIDLLLEKLALSRANLIYAGGGHCYMLLPATDKIKGLFNDFIDEINEWYLEHFQTSLYIAGGYVECSSNELHNEPSGSYKELYRKLGNAISLKKTKRYNAGQIIRLNSQCANNYERECSVCKNVGSINDDGICDICNALKDFSNRILDSKITAFSVVADDGRGGLILPGKCILLADSEDSLRDRMKNDRSFVRAYGKNRMYTGKHVATKLWVGDYSSSKSFEELAKSADGIERIAVLRADVDNLGQAIVAGFNEKYATLSRTATLSRQLSLFFKLYINRILNNPQFNISGCVCGEGRHAAIVYSGGDDLFIVGAWNEVIELAIDIRRCLQKYSENTLKISAGIGIYEYDYPISVIAEEVAGMEDMAKKHDGKNAITFNGDVYGWEEFENEVIGSKLEVIRKFFGTCDDKGKSLLYRMLDLIAYQSDRINFARFVYLIARLEPDVESSPENKALYAEFSKQMYEWLSTDDTLLRDANCRQLKTAIMIYAYMIREREDEK